MDEFHGSATTRLPASARDVFALITDIHRLAEWNDAIERVLERPDSLAPGAQWLAVMHPRRMPRWHSRATVTEIDADGLRFSYRSQSDDGNPTYVDWHWEVVPAGGDAVLTVSWDGYPKTLGRKLFAAPLRKAGLEREVAASLSALASALAVETDAHR